MVAKSKINKVEKITSEHWRLLLLADPSKHLVQNYLQMGQVFDIKKDDRPIAILVLEAVSERGLEIKNIAVDPRFENQGFASRLLYFAIQYSKNHKYQQLQIGTGSTSFKQLYLYQKFGFRVTDIKQDFFTKNYKQPIYENRLLLKDMLVLTMNTEH